MRPDWRVLALVVLFLAGAVQAQDRAPEARQAAADLAYVLGQSHALRQACAGADDQYWRGRMLELLQAEAPDDAQKARLSQSFNAGFAAGQAGFPSCTAAARAEGQRIAARGAALASRLASP